MNEDNRYLDKVQAIEGELSESKECVPDKELISSGTELVTEFSEDYVNGFNKLKTLHDENYQKFLRHRAIEEQYVNFIAKTIKEAPPEVLAKIDVPEGDISITALLPELYKDNPDRSKNAADTFKFNKFVKQWNEECYKYQKELYTCMSELKGKYS